MENTEKIKEKLNTKFLGKEIIYLEEVDSTQDYIKRLMKDGLNNGLVVIAENQINGRGTNGRTWHTKIKENLTFSFLLKPNCNISKFKDLTVIVAKTIVETIKELYGYDLEIKYPNDIMIGNKKCGGILTESYTLGENVENIIVGIGLNINQVEFLDELKDIATSLKKSFNQEFSRVDIISVFLNKFEEKYFKII